MQNIKMDTCVLSWKNRSIHITSFDTNTLQGSWYTRLRFKFCYPLNPAVAKFKLQCRLVIKPHPSLLGTNSRNTFIEGDFNFNQGASTNNWIKLSNLATEKQQICTLNATYSCKQQCWFPINRVGQMLIW